VSFAGKVAVLPCTGVGQVVGTIARQAAYRVCEDDRPDDTILLCLPAMVRGVQEDIDMVRQCPVVVVEGCKHRCAAYALTMRGGAAAATVFIPDVLRGAGVRVGREARRQLSDAEWAAVALVAEAVVAEVDRLGPAAEKGEAP